MEEGEDSFGGMMDEGVVGLEVEVSDVGWWVERSGGRERRGERGLKQCERPDFNTSPPQEARNAETTKRLKTPK